MSVERDVVLSKPQMEFMQFDCKYGLFRGGVGSGKCLKAGTLVKTPKGSVPIEQIKAGDEVYGYNSDNTISICKVTALHDQGIKEIVDLKNFNKTLTSCTMDHRMLSLSKRSGKVVRKVKRLKEFKRDDQISTFNVDIPGGTKNVKEAYAIGAMLGDGCCKSAGLVISSSNESIVRNTALSLGLETYKRNNSNYNWRIHTGPKGYTNAYYDSWCKNRYAHEKTIDIQEVRTWNRKSQIELLSGLIDTDGSVYMSNRLNIQLGMQAKIVIEAAQSLILDLFQVQTTIFEDKREKYKNGPIWYLRVSINSYSKRILKQLTTVCDSKQYKKEYDALNSRTHKEDSVGFSISEPYMSQTYDLTIDNDTHLYLLSNGIVTHNTHAGALWVLKMAIEYPNTKGLIVANTYTQLGAATLPTLFKILNEYNIPFNYVGGAKAQLTIGSSIIHCRSAQNYDNLRGPEYGYAWLDEAGFFKIEAIHVIIGRLRCPKGPRQLRFTTTPQGFNWLYDFFEEQKDESKRTVTSKTSDNVYLPEDYEESLENQYDEKLLAQETGGQYINTTSGQVYYAFDREKHVKDFDTLEIKRGYRYVGSDFNVNPITSMVAWDFRKVLYVQDEIWKKNSNTEWLAGEIYRKWRSHNLIIYPDSTGNARKSSAGVGRTDHQILKNKGFQVRVRNNPFVKDRVNCVNGLLAHNRIIINPKCVKLIKDLEQFTHDNTDDMLSHISDCLGYVAWWRYPLKDTNNRSYTKEL